MIVAQLIEPRVFRLAQDEIEAPAPGQVQVRVNAVGICGSDLHAYSEGGVGDSPNLYPMVLGHEPAGTVVKTGAGVTGWSVGDRAVLEPAHYCYHCEFCRSGRHNLCSKILFLSTPGNPGFFREFVNLPVTNVIAIPQRLSLEMACLVEPLAIALHSLTFTALSIGQTVAVWGAGPIGLVTIACLKLAGAGRVFAIEPVPHRRELAKRMGADAALDPAAVDVARQLMADTGQRGVDIAMDCAAKKETMNEAFRAAAHGARVVLTGIHSEAHVDFEVSHMRRKELAIFNVRRSNHESEAALEIILRNPARFAPLLTHTRGIEKIAEAFSIAEHYADGVGKMIVKPA